VELFIKRERKSSPKIEENNNADESHLGFSGPVP